jgi:hypothetical protein
MHLQKLGDDCGTRNLDEDDMVETNAVERVEQSKTTLNFVRFDHAFEDVANGQRLSLASQVVRNGKNSAQVI